MFQSDREGDSGLFWQRADGVGPAERLTRPEPGMSHVPESASPRGDVLLFSARRNGLSSLLTLSLRDRTTALFSNARDLHLPPDATFSPDGRWVAYQVGEAIAVEGRTYVEPFPPTGTLFQVSQGGRPLWSPDGRQLYLIPAPGRLVVVNVQTEPTVSFTSPVPVSRGFGVANPGEPRPFDVLPIDGRIVGIGTPNGVGGRAAAEVRVVLNWFEELKRLDRSR